MALCRTCDTVIPCHCHLAPPVQTRPGVYLTVTRGFKLARRTTRVIVEAERTEDPS